MQTRRHLVKLGVVLRFTYLVAVHLGEHSVQQGAEDEIGGGLEAEVVVGDHQLDALSSPRSRSERRKSSQKV